MSTHTSDLESRRTTLKTSPQINAAAAAADGFVSFGFILNKDEVFLSLSLQPKVRNNLYFNPK